MTTKLMTPHSLTLPNQALVEDHPFCSQEKLIKELSKEAIFQLIEAKEKNIQEMTSLSSRIQNKDEWILCGGDFFTMGYLFFEMLIELTPHLSKDPSVQALSVSFGIVGGIINILVGLISLKSAWIELEAGRTKIAARLFLDAFGLTAIGLIMTIMSLSYYTALFGGVTALFASNPWLLPTLFFLINLPVLLEVLERCTWIIVQKDPATLYLKNEKPFFDLNLGNLNIESKEEMFKILLEKNHERLEKLQGEIGAEAALAWFQLRLEKDLGFSIGIDPLTAIFEKKNLEWKQAQFVRLLQMLCCLAAFSLTCMTGIKISNIQAMITLLEMLTNLIPLYMDLFWPLKRNTHLPIPGLLSNRSNESPSKI